MIKIAISAFFVWAFFRIRDKNGPIDGFTAISFILVSTIIVFFARMGILAFEGPMWLIYILELTYFIVPFLFLKRVTDYSITKIASYSAIVLVMNFVGQITASVLTGVPST